MEIFDITNLHLYISVALSILNATLLTFVSYKFFQIIQVSNYHLASYFHWLKDSRGKYVSRIAMLSLLSTGCLVVTNVIFNNFLDVKYLSYLGLIFYFYFISIYVKNVYTQPEKKPLKYTQRMSRIIIACFIVNVLITFLLMCFSYKYTDIFKFSVIALTPLLVPLLVPFCHILLLPIELLIQRYYLTKADKKLSQMPSLIRIGITGSYAKTTTKDILSTVLRERYNVCYTPNSFNTPMGIAKTVNNYLKPSHEVLVCEMGATYKGDIEKLTKLVKPSYTILTSVANQHLLTFKTVENIMETKYEIVKYSAENAICVFNGNNPRTMELYKREIENKEKVLIKYDDENSFLDAKNIVCTTKNTSFDLVQNGQILTRITTKLVGGYQVENILMAITIALKLGLSIEEIKTGIEKCEQTGHRLNAKDVGNNITIIDDSFNGNELGTKRALEYLSLYNDRRKIVMTPGLVDLGVKEKQINYEFGQKISSVADICIIVNYNSKQEIENGLIDSGFNKDNILFCENLSDATKILNTTLKSGDVLLICNDLPDNYI